MAVRFFCTGRVFVNVWSGAATADDARRTLEEAQRAHTRLGLRHGLAGIAILTEDWQRPDAEAREIMSRGHAQLRAYHDSIHLIPLMPRSFLLTAAMSITTVLFSAGTGGRLHTESSVQEALDRAEQYGELLVEKADILGYLRRMKIPTERQLLATG